MPVITDIQTISTTIGNIIDFVSTNNRIKPDFEEYLKTINATNLSSSKLQAASVPYITERIIYPENKSVTEIYLEENKNLSDLEKEIVEGISNSISSIFEIKRVLRNGFTMYNYVNEKTYTVIPLVKMSKLRDVLQGQFALVRIFKFKEEYFMLEISDVIPSYEKDYAINFAVAKIIERPEDMYYDNEEKYIEVESYVKNSVTTFKKFFGTNEIITTNNQIDDLVDLFNDYAESSDEKLKQKIPEYIEKTDDYKYFQVQEFENSYGTFLKKSMEGFSSHSEKYDVGYLCDDDGDEVLGVYIIPFWATLSKIFTSKNYKEIQNYKECVENFIKNDKIPPIFIKRLADKIGSHKDFETRLFEILEENTTLENLIKKYKGEYLKKTIFSSANALYCSKTFAEAVAKIEE